MLTALAARRPVQTKVALVVAHPDDETLAAGGSLRLMPDMLLIHVTDGAPRRLDDAARHGFSTPAAYAAARADELTLALALSGADPARETLGIPDQDAIDYLDDIAARLRALCTRHHVGTVMTHAYEGGHPDHDAVACAVHSLGLPVLEFAGYHADANGSMITQEFLPASDRRGVEIALPPSDFARKREMLACFRSQTEILDRFDPKMERFREAPAYDFSRPPHPGRLLYEAWGWMDGQTWRQRAGQARCLA